MNRKRAVLCVTLIVLLTALLCSASLASAAKYKALRYRIVKHGPTFDVVRGHGQKLRVHDHARYVKGRGGRTYRVVKRQRRSVVLRRVSVSDSPATYVSGNTPISSGTPEPDSLPASASSAQAGNSPPSGNDGLSITRWCASSRKYPQWWMVDLGTTSTVTGVQTDWYDGSTRAYRYRVETSLDGVTFTTAADRSRNRTKGITTDGMDVPARYVRVRVLGASDRNAWASANEVTVYTDAAAPPEPTPTDSPSPTPTPTETPSATPTPTLTPSPSPTPPTTPEPTPTSPTAYGCTKPAIPDTPASVTTSGGTTIYSNGTLNNVSIGPGTHDVTYSYVKFTGSSGSGPGGQAVVRMNMGTSGAPIYNITFDHCVFTTLPRGGVGNAFHSWNNNVNDDTGLHDITFSNCWFEPQPRMQIEMNCFGGWQRDITIDRCTFEPCVGEILSICLVNESFLTNGGVFASPWVASVAGELRGIENLKITNNDLQGTGLPDAYFGGGALPEHFYQGVELAGVWDRRSRGTGASTFSNNRIGRCRGTWLNLSAGGIRGMTFEKNLFDYYYNPAGIATYNPELMMAGVYLENSTFRDNTWRLCDETGKPASMWYFPTNPSPNLSRNTFVRETYIKGPGKFAYGPSWPFTQSTYTDCAFHLPSAVYFPPDARGTGCVFDAGYVGGTFD